MSVHRGEEERSVKAFDLRSPLGEGWQHAPADGVCALESVKSRPSTFVQDRGPVLGERKIGSSFRRSASRFLVEEQREHEMKREGETRTGLGFGVWKEQKETFSVCRNESALIRHSELDSESGFALRSGSRIGVRDDSTGTLRDDEKLSFSRERSELSTTLFLKTLHSQRSTLHRSFAREAELARRIRTCCRRLYCDFFTFFVKFYCVQFLHTKVLKKQIF